MIGNNPKKHGKAMNQRGKCLSGGERERTASFPRPLPVSKTDVKRVQTHKKMNTNKSEQQLGNHSWKRSGLFRCGLRSGDSSCRLTLWSSHSLGINSLQLPPSHPQPRKNVNRPDNLKQSYVLRHQCFIIELFMCLLSSGIENSNDFLWDDDYSTK